MMCMRGPLAEPPKDAMPKIRPVRRCWHCAECRWLAQQRCLFMHTEQEQRDVPLRKEDEGILRLIEEVRAEIGILRDAVTRLAASIMWVRGSVLTDGVQVIPQECAHARTSEQCENIPGPLIKEDIAEVVQVIPQERLRARIGEQSALILVLPAKEDIAGIVQGLPPEHDQRSIADQSVLFPVPPINLSSVPAMFPAKWRMKRANTWSPPVLTRNEPDGNPRPSPRQSADGQPSPAEKTRLQGRGLCGQPDAGENKTSILQRNPRIPSASAEEPRLADRALVNAKPTRAKTDGMQTPAAESCSQH